MEVQDVDAQPLYYGSNPHPGGVQASNTRWTKCYVYLKQGGNTFSAQRWKENCTQGQSPWSNPKINVKGISQASWYGIFWTQPKIHVHIWRESFSHSNQGTHHTDTVALSNVPGNKKHGMVCNSTNTWVYVGNVEVHQTGSGDRAHSNRSKFGTASLDTAWVRWKSACTITWSL